jgi:hypothetical protein
MNAYSTIIQSKKVLANLDKWLDAAVAYAKKKGFDPNNLLTQRLAPDQYTLVRQVQSAADAAKFMAARLSGKEAPAHPDTETTIDELKKRLATVIAYLDGFKAEDFKDVATRTVPLNFMPGKGLSADDYLHEMALPNFYFHVAHAYAILRHNGVELGKRDYLGSLNVKDL